MFAFGQTPVALRTSSFDLAIDEPLGFFEGSGFSFSEAVSEAAAFEGVRGAGAPKRKEAEAVVVEAEAKRHKTKVPRARASLKFRMKARAAAVCTLQKKQGRARKSPPRPLLLRALTPVR